MSKFISFLIHKCHFTFLDFLISSLAEFEVNLHLFFDKELLNDVQTCDVVVTEEKESLAKTLIPEDTFYCSSCSSGICPFYDTSAIAGFFFGHQMDGYCHYLHRGDFSYGHYTTVLWDAVKECGINEYGDEE